MPVATKWMKNSAKTVLIGYGNSLREDDGFGPAVAALLSQHGGIKSLAAHQLVPEMAQEIAQGERVIFVDINIENPPGVFAVPLTNAYDPLGHTLTPWQVIELARVLFDFEGDFLVFSVGGACFGHQERLSPPVAQAAEVLSRSIKEQFTL